MFNKIRKIVGLSGLEVETVLDNPSCQPGAIVAGLVNLSAKNEAQINGITVTLAGQVEAETSNGEQRGMVDVQSLEISGPIELKANEQRSLPFKITIPWEAPLTAFNNFYYGNRPDGSDFHSSAGGHGYANSGSSRPLLGIRTDVAVAKAVDKGDFDALLVNPLPSQLAVLNAISEMSFELRHVDLELGQLHGIRQQLPFFQELEFVPRHHDVAKKLSELEVTFVTDSDGMYVVLEADKRGTLFGGSHDTFLRLRFDHSVTTQDAGRKIAEWIEKFPDANTLDLRSGHKAEHGHGGAMAGGMLGAVAGGLVMGEVFDEVGDFFEGE